MANDEMICFTNPREIDGPPTVVRETSMAQLRDAAIALAALVESAAGQILSADVGEMLEEGQDPADNFRLLWSKTPRGEAVEDLRQAAGQFIGATSRLLRSTL